MKEFPREVIESWRQNFEKAQLLVEEVHLGDLDVSYFVIPQEKNPSLPDFAFRMTNTDPETHEVTGVFGVSDSVPAALRPYWMAHEIIEFNQIGINKEGRCPTAEERVMQLIPDDLRTSYRDRRIGFFENLSEFFKQQIEANTGDYTEEDLQEAQATLAYLKGLQEQGN